MGGSEPGTHLSKMAVDVELDETGPSFLMMQGETECEWGLCYERQGNGGYVMKDKEMEECSLANLDSRVFPDCSHLLHRVLCARFLSWAQKVHDAFALRGHIALGLHGVAGAIRRAKGAASC